VAEDWSDDELRASVAAYRSMQVRERTGEKGFKREVYRSLQAQFGRTEKAFEFRMQNISAVLAILGRDWITGLKPAAHVGTNVATKLERIINELDGAADTPRVAFEIGVREQVKRAPAGFPAGQAHPERISTTVSTFMRDPEVKAWVLRRASGTCECCDKPAPFELPDGSPYLEVHHLQKLADGGSDTVTNAAGICPNCHRELHYGKSAADRRRVLLSKIQRQLDEEAQPATAGRT
jgi:hypothetical protein